MIGGRPRFMWCPAMHSSEPSGRPVGYVLEFADGRTLYDEGDTWIFGDMALIQEFYHPNIILMGCGAVVGRSICAHGLASGQSLLQAASSYSDALRRGARVAGETDIRAVVGNDRE